MIDAGSGAGAGAGDKSLVTSLHPGLWFKKYTLRSLVTRFPDRMFEFTGNLINVTFTLPGNGYVKKTLQEKRRAFGETF